MASAFTRQPIGGTPLFCAWICARIQAAKEGCLPHGFEFRIAEIGSATTKASGAVELPDLVNSYGQFARIHLSNKGVIEVNLKEPRLTAGLFLSTIGSAATPRSSLRPGALAREVA